MRDHKRRLLHNTLMLYLLTFSGYLFSFITVPYQTRVLGLEGYAVLGFAQAICVYVQLLLDFGFLLSATEEVASCGADKAALSRLVSAVLWCKLILAAAALGVLLGLCALVPRLREQRLVHILYFFSALFSALLPDFLYRGMEQMQSLTVRAVAVRLAFTVMIFLFLRSADQVYLVPLLNALGGLGALMWTYRDISRRFGVRLVPVDAKTVWRTLRRSGGYFFSRMASTVYGAANTVIVGFLYPVGPVLGSFTGAEKLVSTAKGALAPIADSLYPYMVRHKDFGLIRRMLLVLMPMILLGCIGVGWLAEPFCALLLGEEFRPAGRYLRLLLPVVALALPVYLTGFPLLSPMGLARYANISSLAGAAFHALMLLAFWVSGSLTVERICLCTGLTEGLILLIRLAAAKKGGKP